MTEAQAQLIMRAVIWAVTANGAQGAPETPLYIEAMRQGMPPLLWQTLITALVNGGALRRANGRLYKVQS